MKKGFIIALLLSGAFIHMLSLSGCRRNDASGSPTPVEFTVPTGFPAPSYDFTNNPLTKEGIALGRKLFYDGQMSKDGNFPCASCHQQFAAFATFDHDLSHGFNNAFTKRNAPATVNLAWESSFHHDGGINNLEVQPLAPITAPEEMAETIENVLAKLRNDPTYPSMFKSAFGTEEVNSQRMLKALAQFQLTIVSANSKYDQVKQGKASFTSVEQTGYQIFQAKCSTCHKEPLFTDHSFRNTGLAVNTSLKDYGRYAITGSAADSMKFKVPSLRNVDITYPYMHDGRFWSLSQAIEHYRSGVTVSTTVDPLVRNGISLSSNDVQYLVYFLRTLTDSSLLNNQAFKQP